MLQYAEREPVYEALYMLFFKHDKKEIRKYKQQQQPMMEKNKGKKIHTYTYMYVRANNVFFPNVHFIFIRYSYHRRLIIMSSDFSFSSNLFRFVHERNMDFHRRKKKTSPSFLQPTKYPRSTSIYFFFSVSPSPPSFSILLFFA